MVPFKYLRPQTLREASAMLVESGPQSRVFAGGTDLLVQGRSGKIAFTHVIDLKGVPGLSFIRLGDDGVAIGPLTTIEQIHASKMIQAKLPLLADACGQLGSVQTRNKATIGGNLCNASPSAETACPLLVLGAQVNIWSLKEERIVGITEFFIGPGKTVLGFGEIVKTIFIPFPEGMSGSYLKLGRRKAMEIAVANVAVIIKRKENVCLEGKIAIGAVAPIPMRASKAEAILSGAVWSAERVEQASEEAAIACKPISDVRASEWYRRKMVKVLVRRALDMAWDRLELKS